MIARLKFPALLLALSLGVSGRALAQDRPMGGEHPMKAQHEAMMARHETMMAQHEAMMAAMKAADARLDSLVAEMSSATGDAKVNAVTAVVAELVTQHEAMHAHMAEMMGQGTHGMMCGPGEGHGQDHPNKPEGRSR